jgi:hypothetical protein
LSSRQPSASAGNGRCNDFASSHGARIHTSRSSSVARIVGTALGWIGMTSAFGAVVRKPNETSMRAWIGLDLEPPARERRTAGQTSFQRKRDHVLFLGLGVRLRRVLGEAVERHKASVLRLEPDAPNTTTCCGCW